MEPESNSMVGRQEKRGRETRIPKGVGAGKIENIFCNIAQFLLFPIEKAHRGRNH